MLIISISFSPTANEPALMLTAPPGMVGAVPNAGYNAGYGVVPGPATMPPNAYGHHTQGYGM